MHVAHIDLTGSVKVKTLSGGETSAFGIDNIALGESTIGDGRDYAVIFASYEYDAVSAWAQGAKAFRNLMRPSYTQGE